MAKFRAEVNSYYGPRFDAATLSDAIAHANANYVGDANNSPARFDETNISIFHDGAFTLVWLLPTDTKTAMGADLSVYPTGRM